jgi:transcriptional regulator with XRE-family HTH domain
MARRWTGQQFGKQVKAEREHQKWTQTEMAKLLTDNGFPIGSTGVAKIEAGTRVVRIDEAVAISDLLGVPLETLLGRTTVLRTDEAYRLKLLAVGASRYAHQVRDIEGALAEALRDAASIKLPQETDSLAIRGQIAGQALRTADKALCAITQWIDTREASR